jgi:D-cysteine desulfhydrase
MAVKFPPRLSLANTPTPLQALDRFSEKLGGPRLWIKRDDLTGSATSGNKIRKLEFVLAEAIAQGCDTIITCGGVQSNHCRTTALLCAQLGLHCCLLLRGERPDDVDGNLLLDQLAGAEIRYYESSDFVRQMQQGLFDKTVAEFASHNKKAFVIPVGASDGIGLWGYVAACEELKADFIQHNIKPKYIFTATGSGGTHAGLIAGNQLFKLDTDVWGVCVCDDEETFRQKIRTDLSDWKQRYSLDYPVDQFPINLLDGYVAPGYAQAIPEVYKLISDLARCEGIVLDPVYTGKAFYALVDQIRQGHFCEASDIVFIHTGGIFGLFPQRQLLFPK